MYIYNTLYKDIHTWICVILKTQSLCTSAKSDLGGRVLGEVEKNNVLPLPAEGDAAGGVSSPQVSALKTACSHLER